MLKENPAKTELYVVAISESASNLGIESEQITFWNRNGMFRH